MDDNLTPFPSSRPVAAPRRQWNPLVVVLSLSGLFFVTFVAISAFLFLGQGSDSARPVAGGLFGDGSVGVIELNGPIMESKKILKKLASFEEDDSIKAVVLRLNSPGGAVAPSQEIYDAVRAYQKPLVASMGSVAASGAFYIAMGAKKIFANAGTLTGSIGVIMEFANLSKLYEWAKVQRYAIKTGRFKDAGAEYKEMDTESRALLQALVDDVLMQFKDAVVKGRRQSLEKVTAIADGRIFSGAQALKLGMVDQLGGIQDAINEAGKLAKIKGKPKVVYPDRRGRNRVMDFLLDERGDEAESLSHGEGAAIEGVIAKTLRETVGNRPVLEPGIYWIWAGAR